MKASRPPTHRLFENIQVIGLAFGLTLAGGCGSNASTSGSGGTQGTGGATSGSGGSSTSTGGGNPGSGGKVGTGGAVGSGGATGGSGSGGQGASTATGGSSGGASTGGANGSGGRGGSTTTGGNGGGTVPTGGSSGGGATGNGQCPTNATFCSGFEDSGLPTGASYKLNGNPTTLWTTDFEVTTAQHKSGKSSLRVKPAEEAGTSGSAYKMLAVPAPTDVFWVRFYIQQTDMDLGMPLNNNFAAAVASDDPNESTRVEFSEDVSITLRTDDGHIARPDGYSRDKPFTLPKGAWHCVEINFNGKTNQHSLYINNTNLIVDAVLPPIKTGALKMFRFGFSPMHGPSRSVYYDDVAVAPSRIGCLP